jgi:putative ABC transport system permease protein
MVISVLERRTEIGPRRALGVARRHTAVQFLSESLLLSALGGIAGAVLGTAVTSGVAAYRGWQTLVPLSGVWGGLAATLVIGTIAGLHPATRAARLNPTDALRTA